MAKPAKSQSWRGPRLQKNDSFDDSFECMRIVRKLCLPVLLASVHFPRSRSHDHACFQAFARLRRNNALNSPATPLTEVEIESHPS
jgi:hypothetical protein